MKKLANLLDPKLRKLAESRGQKYVDAIDFHTKAKIAMLVSMLDAAEQQTGVILNNQAKRALVKEASQYIPVKFMAKKGEAANVLKYADAVLTKLLTAGLSKKKEALLDIPAMRKFASDSNIDAVEPTGVLQNADGSENPTAKGLPEEKLVDMVYDNLGDSSEEKKPVHDAAIQSASKKLDTMAAVNAPAIAPDLSNPNPGAVVNSAIELNSVDKQAASTFQRINRILDGIEGINKTAAPEVAPAVPHYNDGTTATAAEEADKDSSKDVTSNPSTSETIIMDAGKAMDLLAANTDLESLISEEGASEEDQVNPITAPEAVQSTDSKRQVTTSDSGSSKTPKSASVNFFSEYIDGLTR